MSNFTPTADMLSAARAVFMAKAYLGTIEPIVTAYKKEILERHQFTNKGEVELFARRGLPCEERVITENAHLYLLGEEDFLVYLRECNEARKQAGLRVESEEYCPLLVAEHLLVDAERALIEAMRPVTNIAPHQVYGENWKKIVDLSLGLLAPFIGNADQILQNAP